VHLHDSPDGQAARINMNFSLLKHALNGECKGNITKNNNRAHSPTFNEELAHLSLKLSDE
jgi:hypothetical protein